MREKEGRKKKWSSESLSRVVNVFSSMWFDLVVYAMIKTPNQTVQSSIKESITHNGHYN